MHLWLYSSGRRYLRWSAPVMLKSCTLNLSMTPPKQKSWKNILLGANTEGTIIEAEGWERRCGWGPSGGGSNHQLRDLGSALWAPPAGFGEDPRPPKGFCTIFSTQDGLSRHYCGLSHSHWGAKTPVRPAHHPCVHPYHRLKINSTFIRCDRRTWRGRSSCVRAARRWLAAASTPWTAYSRSVPNWNESVRSSRLITTADGVDCAKRNCCGAPCYVCVLELQLLVLFNASIFGFLIDHIKWLFIVFLTAYLITQRLLILKL